jgi:pSer/pThr/pTyr-binding forkhead associated (FHA) protein/tetratricopeptide (TPR) repeat protein
MARLRVRLRGKITQDLQLAPDRTYLAGRRDDCDIVLLNEKGISREHFKIFFAGDKWNIEVMSRFGDMLADGEKIQQMTLEGSKLFYVGPYEFEYSEVSSDLVAVGQAGLPEEAMAPAYAEADVQEKTFIGSNNTVPYIKVVNSDGDVKELFKLEGGDTWIAGRDSSCDIAIRDQRVSRRQFEVRRQGNFFLIMDLGSVNGTLVNGNPVSSTDPVVIKSGDAISVLDNHLYFELHDPDFKARMELVKSQAPNPLVTVQADVVPVAAQYGQHVPMAVGEMPPAHLGYGYPAMGPGTYQPPPENKKFDFEKHRVKLIGGAILLLGVAYFFSDQGGSKAPQGQPQQGVAVKPQEAFKKLSPEQQILVKQTYMLAKNLYMQGKYELAKAEVTKIYELVPDYEDTKDIERLANEALVIQEQKRQQEQLEQKMAENREKIEKQTAECQAKITPEFTMAQLEECLGPVLEFDPGNAKFTELRRRVEEYTHQKQVREAQKAEYSSQVAKLRGLFNRAESSHKENQYLRAIKEYQAVAGSSLPDPGELKPQSRRQIAAIQQTLKQKIDQLAGEAEQLSKDQKLKDAILTLRKAVEINPGNEETKDKINRYTLDLKKQMMVLYQEGVLEESYGNVEGNENRPGAKDKWKKIMDLDIPDGEYYGKAKIKLKKYGAL